MNKNKLGNSGIEVSQLTLGCMSLGTDFKEAKNIIDFALDQGINHLDTADLYDFGINEEIVGKAINGKRKEIVLTSKVGNHFNKQTGDWFWDPSKEHIIQGVKESLQRLNTDYIDFYMLHGGTIDDPIDETIEAFELLKQEGTIRAYGISSIRPNVIREYVGRSSIDGVMMQYNLFDRRPEEKILDFLYEHSISVLARGPLAKGMLSNHANQQIEKKGKDGYLGYSREALLQISEQLNEWNPTTNRNELSLKYVLKHPTVASAVFGASSVNQLKETIDGDFHSELPDEIYSALQHLSRPITYQTHR
ncbi:aldo/keto reductase [Virgibacillus salexigens]|uniref:aldo/keto reductase n=1 Tax=Virgibacillus salexigens TaxID=61016 RepID=UPI003081610F